MLLVFGSRPPKDPAGRAAYEVQARHLITELLDRTAPTCVLEGEADGPDRWAREEAVRRAGEGWTFQAEPVTDSEWRERGKRAGHLRNERMARILRSQPAGRHVAVGIWDGTSPGTRNMITNLYAGPFVPTLILRPGPWPAKWRVAHVQKPNLPVERLLIAGSTAHDATVVMSPHAAVLGQPWTDFYRELIKAGSAVTLTDMEHWPAVPDAGSRHAATSSA